MSVLPHRRAGFLCAAAVLALTPTVLTTPVQAQQSAAPWPQGAAPPAPTYGTVLDEISVTAERGARQRLDVPQTVTVIDRQELDRRMVRDVQDLVRYEPGVTVSKTTSSVDPFSNLAGFTIRGVSNNRVQMLIDGTRVIESIVDGNRDFINMANLKAVEIMRGPAGVFWGSDALGGTVAFVTKDPSDYLKGRDFGGQVDTTYDSLDDSFFKTASVAARTGDFQWLISASHRAYNEATLSRARADGGLYGCPRPPEAIRCNELNPLDGSDYDLLGKMVWLPNPENEVKLTGEYVNRFARVDQRHDLGLQTNGITNLSYIRDQEQTRYRTTLMHRYSPYLGWLDQVKWQLSMSPFERDFTGDRNRRLANGNREQLDFLLNYQEKFYEADLQLNSSFLAMMAEHRLTYGGYYNITETDYVRRDVTTNLTTGAVSVANAGGFNFANATTTRADLFFQDDIRPTELFNGRVTISPGLRYATYLLEPRPDQFYRPIAGKEPREIYSEELVKQVNVRFALSDEHTLFARYAEGFKMPTAQQLFTSVPSTTGNSLIPNPMLKPESVQSYELSLRRKFARGFYSVTVFKSDYKDFIQNFVPLPTFSNGFQDLTYDNISRVNLIGYEVSGEFRLTDKWSTTLAASYITGHQQADPTSPVTAFNGSTPLTIVNGLRYLDIDRGIDAEVFSTWADKVGSRAAANEFRPDSYLIFDALFTYRPPGVKGLALRASVLNIGDTRYFRSLNGATTYTVPPGAGVAAANPLELQTGPGRTFKVGMNYEF